MKNRIKKQLKNKIDKQVDVFKNWLRFKLKNWLYPINDNIQYRSQIYDLYSLEMIIDVDERHRNLSDDEMMYRASQRFGFEMQKQNLINVEQESFDTTEYRPPWIKRNRLYVLLAVIREERKPKIINPRDIKPYKRY